MEDREDQEIQSFFNHHQQLIDSHHIPRTAPNTINPDPNSVSTPITANVTAAAATSLATATDHIVVPKYRECLKNHAASMGGHVVDGCGEFMPSGEENTPEGLKCAACECHRSFHWREIDTGTDQPTSHYQYPNPNKANTHHIRISNSSFPSQIQSLHHNYRHIPSPSIAANGPVMVAFGSGGVASSSEDLNLFDGGGRSGSGYRKKRFRTKFTREQKGKMTEFAEKIEWSFQKQDEVEIQRFCSELGLKRQVFKVWIHNNKQSMKKKQM